MITAREWYHFALNPALSCSFQLLHVTASLILYQDCALDHVGHPFPDTGLGICSQTTHGEKGTALSGESSPF